MELDRSAMALSSEYFVKIVSSVPVQSFVYSVKRTGDKTLPCGTPFEMDRSPDNTPSNRTNCFLWHKKLIIQLTNYGLIFNLIRFFAKRYGLIALNAEENSANRIRT